MYFQGMNGVPTVAQQQQQRLMQLEQQYPQYAQNQQGQFNSMQNNNMNNMNNQFMQNQQQQQQFTQQQQQNVFKGRKVTSIEEVKSILIDFDGEINVFLDTANNKIYTKQINLDGTASINTYKIDDTPVDQNSNIQNNNINNNFVEKQEFETLKQEIGRYKSVLDELLGGNANATNESINANV